MARKGIKVVVEFKCLATLRYLYYLGTSSDLKNDPTTSVFRTVQSHRISEICVLTRIY